jgi:hypothetical protein
MSAIASVGSQPPLQLQQASAAAKPVDRDGDHDNDATESGAAKAHTTSASHHVVNLTA